jgi:hypothetical protein
MDKRPISPFEGKENNIVVLRIYALNTSLEVPIGCVHGDKKK